MGRIKAIARNLHFILIRKITDPMELRLNQRADRYERAVDDRIEERFKAMDKYRSGIIDRTDVMLQIFEQRLDQ